MLFRSTDLDYDAPVHPILEGIASGDALGFPYEGIKPKKVRWGFVGRWGITSDDTQLAHIAYLALNKSKGDTKLFARILVQKFSLWFLCLPPTLGLATLRACLKMLLGLNPENCGVNSSGNGPLPRAIILGWELAKDPKLEEYVNVSTKVTHTGYEAIVSSYALAKLVAYLRVNGYPGKGDTILLLKAMDESAQWRKLVSVIEHSHSLFELMQRTGQKKGTGGFAYHTLSVALWLFINRPYRSGMLECIQAGGDTDSVGAVLGGLWAARHTAVPHVWHRILDYPIKTEPSLKRFFYNLFTILVIFLYYVPKRLIGR
jgi:ADP-ribosyl-[dinitrogen reductase] hydrolase